MFSRRFISLALIAALAALPTLSMPFAISFASMRALCGEAPSACGMPAASTTCSLKPAATGCGGVDASKPCTAAQPEEAAEESEEEPSRSCDSCPIMCAWCCKTLTISPDRTFRLAGDELAPHRLSNEATPAGRSLDPPPHPPRWI